jgi:hypothetical protein
MILTFARLSLNDSILDLLISEKIQIGDLPIFKSWAFNAAGSSFVSSSQREFILQFLAVHFPGVKMVSRDV